MICYKDMTFCTFYKDCKLQDECHRPLTPEVITQAEKWMENAPVSMFTNKPDCWVKK